MEEIRIGFCVMHSFCNVFASVSMVCLCFTVLFDGVALEDVRAAISFICFFVLFWRGGISQSPMVLHVAVCLDLRLRFLKNAAACLRLLLCDYCGFFDRSPSFHDYFPWLLCFSLDLSEASFGACCMQCHMVHGQLFWLCHVPFSRL